MKKRYYGIVLLASALLFCGCDLNDLFNGDDDDDDEVVGTERPEGLPSELFSGNWAEPPYLKDAGVFIIEGDAEIERIKLSADGSYLIVPAGFNSSATYSAAAGMRHFAFGRLKKASGSDRTRSEALEWAGQRLYRGTFERIGPNRYVLTDYGTIEITSENELHLTRLDGILRRMRARFEPFTPKVPVEKYICSYSWHPVFAIYNVYRNGELVYNQIIQTPQQLREEFEDYVNFDAPPTVQLPWESYGSIIQVDYDKRIIGIGGWEWIDEAEQCIRGEYTDGDGGRMQFFLAEEDDGKHYCYVYGVWESGGYTSYEIVKCEMKSN